MTTAPTAIELGSSVRRTVGWHQHITGEVVGIGSMLAAFARDGFTTNYPGTPVVQVDFHGIVRTLGLNELVVVG